MYIPKNKILTNLQTQTNQFVIKGTLEAYEGSYWKTHEGKYFTGKNPNDFNVKELILSSEEDLQDTNNSTQIAYGDFQTPFNSLEEGVYSPGLISEYSDLKKINLDKLKSQKLPSFYYSSPTEDDYNLGVFTRYFTVKINENQYLEVDKETYKGIESQNPQWKWDYYTPFKIQWALTGPPGEVYDVNLKNTLVKQKKLNRIGLQSFLNNEYDKFWRPQ